MSIKTAFVSIILAAAASQALAGPVYTPLNISNGSVQFSLTNLPKGAFTGSISAPVNRGVMCLGQFQSKARTCSKNARSAVAL